MNIFMTSFDPRTAAYEHCNVHRNKMIIEVSQMLCTAHRVLDGDTNADLAHLYKATHRNHPCSKFVRSSMLAYDWTYRHLLALHEYYTADTHKVHASARLLAFLAAMPGNQPVGDVFEPVVAMPDDLKALVPEFGVDKVYRFYMNRKLAEWITRDKPIKFNWPFGPPRWVDHAITEYSQ